jgi:hypothetical protein
VVLYEIYSKKIEGDEYICPSTVYKLRDIFFYMFFKTSFEDDMLVIH